MATEWGIFNEEGCMEAGFYDPAEAKAEAARYRERYDQDLDNGDPSAEAKELCPDHEEQPKDPCEECLGEYDEEEEG